MTSLQLAHRTVMAEPATVPLPSNPRYKLMRYGTRGQWGIMDRLTFCWKESNFTKQEAEALWPAYRSIEITAGQSAAIQSATL